MIMQRIHRALVVVGALCGPEKGDNLVRWHLTSDVAARPPRRGGGRLEGSLTGNLTRRRGELAGRVARCAGSAARGVQPVFLGGAGLSGVEEGQCSRLVMVANNDTVVGGLAHRHLLSVIRNARHRGEGAV